MSKIRMVNTSFWSDPWVVDNLNPLDAYLFMYLFTNEHTNVAGVYEISLRTLAFEVKLEKEEVVRMLKRLESRVSYVGGWVVLRKGIKNQNYHSPKIQAGIQIALAKCPPELIDLVDWPDDYGKKPEVGRQTQLQMVDTEADSFDSKNVKKVAKIVTESQKNVVETDNSGVVETDNTLPPLKYGMDTVSHSDLDSDTDTKIATNVAMAEAGSGFGSADVNGLFQFWHQQVGYEITSRLQKNRYACSNLLKRYKVEGVKKLVEGVALAQGDRYGPVIGDFCSLQLKLSDLMAWGKKQSNGKGRIHKL